MHTATSATGYEDINMQDFFKSNVYLYLFADFVRFLMMRWMISNILGCFLWEEMHYWYIDNMCYFTMNYENMSHFWRCKFCFLTLYWSNIDICASLLYFTMFQTNLRFGYHHHSHSHHTYISSCLNLARIACEVKKRDKMNADNISREKVINKKLSISMKFWDVIKKKPLQ